MFRNCVQTDQAKKLSRGFYCLLLLLCAVTAVAHPGKHNRSSEDTVSLFKYAASGDLKSLQTVVESGLPVNASDAVFRATALHNAAGQGHLPIVQWLLANGADVNATDSLGSTPLIWACYGGKTAVIKALLNAGADPNHLPVQGPTALIAAIQSGQPSAVQALLHHGVNHAQPNADGLTPLKAATMTNNQSIQAVMNTVEDKP